MSGVSFDQKPVLGVSALLTHEDYVLLAKRGKEPSKGLWSLPGGKLERGETLVKAAAREVFEETGINVEGLVFVEFVELIKIDYHFVIAVFMAHLADKQPPQAGDDAIDARWISQIEIKALDADSKITSGTFDRISRLTTHTS
ncbi:MAG: NUDIX hydrolase [Hyphomicrobiales bacterium]